MAVGSVQYIVPGYDKVGKRYGALVEIWFETFPELALLGDEGYRATYDPTSSDEHYHRC
jgi:hypothetical protein